MLSLALDFQNSIYPSLGIFMLLLLGTRANITSPVENVPSLKLALMRAVIPA